jgi:hypothetical protein
MSACQIPRSKCERFDDSNSTRYRSLWLSKVDQTSREPSLWSYLLYFFTCKVFQNNVRLPRSQGYLKCFMPPKNLCARYSMLSIHAFTSFCCVFITLDDAKFDRATLLEISFLHFRNASLLHTLTQLAVKSDELTLSSWNALNIK